MTAQSTENRNRPYLIKLWLTTLLLGTFVLTVLECIDKGEIELAWLIWYPVVVLVGAVLSLPALLLCYLSLRLLKSFNFKPLELKVLVGFEAIAFASIILLSIYGETQGWPLAIAYSASTLVGSMIFKVNDASKCTAANTSFPK